MITNQEFYAICDTEGRFWDGHFPKSMKSSNGRMPNSMKSWEPRMLTKTKGWSRVATATRKHREYEVVRLLNANLPPMLVARFEVRPVAVEAVETKRITPEERAFYIIKMVFGKSFAGDFASLKVLDDPDLRYAAQVSYKSRKKLKASITKNFASARMGTYAIFVSEEDAVMLRMIEPSAEIHDLGSILPQTASE